MWQQCIDIAELNSQRNLVHWQCSACAQQCTLYVFCKTQVICICWVMPLYSILSILPPLLDSVCMSYLDAFLIHFMFTLVLKCTNVLLKYFSYVRWLAAGLTCFKTILSSTFSSSLVELHMFKSLTSLSCFSFSVLYANTDMPVWVCEAWVKETDSLVMLV